MTPPPLRVVDVGGGAGNQSLLLARLGYEVTIVDPSPAMLERARQRLAGEEEDVERRVRVVEASSENAPEALDRSVFGGVLCHGVLMYVDDPEPLVDALCKLAAPAGVDTIDSDAANAEAERDFDRRGLHLTRGMQCARPVRTGSRSR